MAAENFPSRGFRPTSQFAIRQPFLRSNNKSVRATSSVQNLISRASYHLVIIVMQLRECRFNSAERTAKEEIRNVLARSIRRGLGETGLQLCIPATEHASRSEQFRRRAREPLLHILAFQNFLAI